MLTDADYDTDVQIHQYPGCSPVSATKHKLVEDQLADVCLSPVDVPVQFLRNEVSTLLSLCTSKTHPVRRACGHILSEGKVVFAPPAVLGASKNSQTYFGNADAEVHQVSRNSMRTRA